MSDNLQTTPLSLRTSAATSWRYIAPLRDIRNEAPRSRGSKPAMLQRAIAYMDVNLGERFSLATLAEAAGMSRFHFARVFRTATGCSPMEFLMRQRVARGKELLSQGGMSICDVAALLGFCDQSHFTRTFRRISGMSPREYLRTSVQARRYDGTSVQEQRHGLDHDAIR